MQRFLKAITPIVAYCSFMAALAQGEVTSSVDVAEFDDKGRLVFPSDVEEWIFLGSSLGMGYSQAEFDPDSPGMFQIVRMEPQAYKAFLETGRFVDGTMFSLHFYGSQNKISINRAGFVMDDLHAAEIHLKDSKRFPDGFNFYNFDNSQAAVEEVPLPNDCVDCHKKDGAYDGVFVQFYPIIRDRVPPEALANALGHAEDSGH